MDNNYYNPYTNTNPQREPEQEPKKKSDLGTKLIQTVAIALVFGLVAGATGVGVMYVGGNSFSILKETDTKPESDKTQSDQTESDQPESDSTIVTNPIPETDKTTNTVVTTLDVSDMVQAAMPCIVAITNTSEKYVQGMWGQTYTQESESCGTGFLVEQDNEYLYIATNNHVVDGAKKLTVQFSDDAEVSAEIKGQVATKDLAVIKVALKDIPEETRSVIKLARLGDSNSLRVGESAIAIGNALGYGQSVTTGVVSALGRSVTVTDSSSGTTIVNNNLIQTDAAINPGNSGGALFNSEGEVIGINSVKYSDTSVEGIGYAIPISDAMLVIEKLISGEQIDVAKAGYLGIQGMDSNYGVYIYKVLSNSAAEKAGLRVGDIITRLEGNTISTMNQLKELLSYYSAGEEVELVVMKAQGNNYVRETVKVILGDASTIEQ